MRIAYVILHFLAINDTIECVDSIFSSGNQTNHDLFVVIVDNGSPNGSGRELKCRFDCNERVKVIINKKNLGFAKGNNIGFNYAKNQIKADFIVMLNNDTIIKQATFNEVLVRKFIEDQYYVLGPDIVTKDGSHQNPGVKQTWSFTELRRLRLSLRLRNFLSYFGLDKCILKLKKTKNTLDGKEKNIGDIKNTILHGACLIFSPLYVHGFNGIYNETFLYMEEDILKLMADYYGFLMMYSNELVIYHKEDIATNMLTARKAKRIRRKNKYIIQSSKKYTKLKKLMIKSRDYKFI